MLIEKNKVVTFHYRVNEAGRETLEDSRDGAPLVYLHGHGGMIPGVEEALTGRQAGDHLEVSVPPEKGYGARNEDAVQRISKSHVLNAAKGKAKFEPGMMVQVNTPYGPRSVVVLKVGMTTLDVDANHPLAGRTLEFTLDVVDVRDASEEEITHGHAHGAGGHEH
ncbi:MAG: peptidylprolyl isomerase [Gammaproteobacteria bacterium]|jgi:FKBP-type peptidyl-prolyl cis-trans isomerase SlyD|nr:peptidylprolyl isomerase [Gammaproteobacteria bacterium]